MIARVLPVTQVKPDLKDAVRMAVAEIERFLAMFYPVDAIRRQESALAIAGQWLSRVKGFHDDDDFLYLVRDFLSWVLSGGERSLASDQLTMFFSGFMPSYGTARTFLGIVNDGGTWLDVRAFMHSQAYGNARQYVENFDWSGGGQKAQAEARAWLAVLKEEDGRLTMASSLVAFVAPGSSPWLKSPPVTDVQNPVLPAAAKAEGSVLSQLLTKLTSLPVVVGITLLAYSPGLNSDEDEALKKIRREQEEYARKRKLAIPAPQVATVVKADTLTIECKAQIEVNKQNGERCENNGYTLMEKVLGYRRLVDPPKGKGLDGLFEKQGDMSAPNPMPQIVNEPPPGGKLVFIPETTRPPKPQYKVLNPEATSPAAYPLFVVFEAKNISKGFDPGDTEGITKEVRRRLGETCKDGTQMNADWITPRIPRALDRGVKRGETSGAEQERKSEQIDNSGYASWIFVCLPGATGVSSKLFVLIDVEASGMKLNRASQPAPSQPADNTF
ncbi:hypothetical protein [Paraburkholderia caballeronis]|uniref:hypothetical protein n=1 Tax=Paraburkholderia caballeronis TaxID=416943 RepID=UPI00106491E9|nr:hypothetical protein [Paraburkholderia caballeronis]TDV06192.1 hypothetical protein C7408_1236 [Paraburkholderia caballeronis]TDV09694.1 hypothetical protein C7406_1256 [Paraburkholderia caballeronis]TDV32878.1 hypothetical protein C7404_1016 [Paraburkholderia caballeronis]